LIHKKEHMEIIMNTEQNHPQQPILKQSFRVPQLLYVKIEDRINIFFREGPSIWSRLSILYGVIQFCERTWRWKVEDSAPWHQNFTRMSNLARNKGHAFADQR
jgi:hypothetical protein